MRRSALASGPPGSSPEPPLPPLSDPAAGSTAAVAPPASRARRRRRRWRRRWVRADWPGSMARVGRRHGRCAAVAIGAVACRVGRRRRVGGRRGSARERAASARRGPGVAARESTLRPRRRSVVGLGSASAWASGSAWGSASAWASGSGRASGRRLIVDRAAAERGAEPVTAHRLERHRVGARPAACRTSGTDALLPVRAAEPLMASVVPATSTRTQSAGDALAIAIRDREGDRRVGRAGARRDLTHPDRRVGPAAGRCRRHEGEHRAAMAMTPSSAGPAPDPSRGPSMRGRARLRARADDWGAGRLGASCWRGWGGTKRRAMVRGSGADAADLRSPPDASHGCSLVDCGVADGPTGRSGYPRSVIEPMGARDARMAAHGCDRTRSPAPSARRVAPDCWAARCSAPSSSSAASSSRTSPSRPPSSTWRSRPVGRTRSRRPPASRSGPSPSSHRPASSWPVPTVSPATSRPPAAATPRRSTTLKALDSLPDDITVASRPDPARRSRRLRARHRPVRGGRGPRTAAVGGDPDPGRQLAGPHVDAAGSRSRTRSIARRAMPSASAAG